MLITEGHALNCKPTSCVDQQDEEQQEIINSAAFIEEQYGHLIDTVLVKEDLQSACNELKTVLDKLNKDSFWVPVSWVRS